MSDFYRAAMPNLSDEQLLALVQDCEARVGSHVMGGNPDENYIEKQRAIVSLVQDEFARRGI